MESVLLSVGYWRTRHSSTESTLIELPFLKLKPGLTQSHFTAEQADQYAAGAKMSNI